MSAVSQRVGDKAVVLTNSLCRYEGFFRSIDWTTATFTLNNVRSFGTEDREAPEVFEASERLYESVEFKVADVKDFVLVGSPVLADPAIVSAREHKEEDTVEHRREFVSSSPSLRVSESPQSYYANSATRQGPRGRLFSDNSSSAGHVEAIIRPSSSSSGSRHGGALSATHGESIGGYGLQGVNVNSYGSGVRGHRQRNEWRTINPRSEGSFPQKHPGMQHQPMEDFDFEEGFEEFTRLKLYNSIEETGHSDISHEWDTGEATSDVEKNDQPRVATSLHHGYDKEKSFFDNLSGSADFDPPRQHQQQQQQHRFGRAAINRAGDSHGGRPRNPNVETFGEDTVKQLYEIRKYAPDQRSSIRSGGYNGWHRSGGFHNNRQGHLANRNTFACRRQWFAPSAFV